MIQDCAMAARVAAVARCTACPRPRPRPSPLAAAVSCPLSGKKVPGPSSPHQLLRAAYQQHDHTLHSAACSHPHPTLSLRLTTSIFAYSVCFQITLAPAPTCLPDSPADPRHV